MIVEVASGTVLYRSIKQIFADVRQLVVSNNGLFLVLDFDFGLTQCFRVRYVQKRPSEVVHISDFSFRVRACSCACGVHGLVASAVDERLVLWEMFGGRIHRVVVFASAIVAIAVDEEYGVWVSTGDKVSFVSMNGAIVAETGVGVGVRVRCFAALQLHRAQVGRVVVCGTGAGELFVMQPLWDTGMVDVVKLPSPHAESIERIIVHRSNKSFVSVDGDEICFRWVVPGVRGPDVRVDTCEACAVCGEPPQGFCTSCGRALCRMCGMSSEGKCSLCLGLEVY
jgi:hypothetical protein